MSEPAKDKTFVVHLTVEELSGIVQDAVKLALKSAPKEDRLLTVEDCCKVLNCDPMWLYHNAKKLPFTRKVGGMLRFSNNDLQRWIASQRFKMEVEK
jgi:predicted DNA-binding transcriptional regulator AlpA